MTTADKERIEKEAADHYSVEFNPVCWMVKREGYIAGATAEHERAQQELQAYRDIIKELIYIAEIYKGVMDKDKRPDYDPGSMLTPTIQKARKLIDTVTPT